MIVAEIVVEVVVEVVVEIAVEVAFEVFFEVVVVLEARKPKLIVRVRGRRRLAVVNNAMVHYF